MNKAKMRGIALGAVRSQMRRQGIRPENASTKAAIEVLDDISRSDPETVAARWYQAATDNQFTLFCSEWLSWRKEELK